MWVFSFKSLLVRGVLPVGVRCLSRDIGQATHYTHPDLLSKDEGVLADRSGAAIHHISPSSDARGS